MRWFVLLAIGCGGSAPAPVPAAVSTVATAAGAGDSVVATVDGRPVWASCVAAQAAARGLDARGALRQCEDFELLAQAAELRGLAADRDVREAARTAAASRLVELDFEQRYAEPASLAGPIEKTLAGRDMHRAEMRASTFLRVDVPKGASADVEAQAKALADELYAPLANRTGLYGSDLLEAGRAHASAGGLTIEASDFPPHRRDRMIPAYGEALFALPEVGRATPPVRTDFGYDIIVWTGGYPAKDWTMDGLVAELFPDARRSQLAPWVAGLAKQAGMQIELADDADALLGGDAK